MTNALKVSVIGCAAVIGAWGLATPVEAYVDPGAGSALLQSLIGSIAVVTGFVAHQWHRISALLRSRDRRRQSSSSE